MAILNDIKNHPLKSLGGGAGSVAAILGLIWALNSHFASAADVQRVERNVDVRFFDLQIQSNKREMRDLKNKIDYIDAKVRTNPRAVDEADRAQRQNYQNQIEELKQENEEFLKQKIEVQKK